MEILLATYLILWEIQISNLLKPMPYLRIKEDKSEISKEVINKPSQTTNRISLSINTLTHNNSNTSNKGQEDFLHLHQAITHNNLSKDGLRHLVDTDQAQIGWLSILWRWVGSNEGL